jgi:hypothetical protein
MRPLFSMSGSVPLTVTVPAIVIVPVLVVRLQRALGVLSWTQGVGVGVVVIVKQVVRGEDVVSLARGIAGRAHLVAAVPPPLRRRRAIPSPVSSRRIVPCGPRRRHVVISHCLGAGA